MQLVIESLSQDPCVALLERARQGKGEVDDVRGIKTFSSGARTNCIVFCANSARYSSVALSYTSS